MTMNALPQTLPFFQTDSAHPQAETVDDLVWLYPPGTNVPSAVSASFGKMFGRSVRSDFDSGSAMHWLTWLHPEDQPRMSRLLQGLAHQTPYQEAIRIVLPEGSVRWVSDLAVSLGSAGMVRITQDISGQRRTESLLDHAQRRNDILLEDGADVIVVTDREGTIREVSRSSARLFGTFSDGLVGRPVLERIDPQQRELVSAQFLRLSDTPAGRVELQCRIRHEDGRWLWLEGTARNLLDEPHVQGIVINCRDTTRRKEAEIALAHMTGELEAHVLERTDQLALANQRLRDADRMQRMVMRALPDVLIRCDRDSRVLDISGPVHQMVATPQELLGTRLIDRPEFPAAVKGIWADILKRALDSGRNQICEYQLQVMAGRKEFEARVTPIGADEAIAIVREVTERNLLRERLMKLATQDELTGLLNRGAFRERLSDLILRDAHRPLAILVIDLDRFKHINDTLGHAIGDTLLKVVANRLTRRVGGEALRARIGGDEFALAVECSTGALGVAEIEALTQALLTELGSIIRINGESVYVTPSIGIAMYPAVGDDADSLLRNADVAMMKAKQSGRNAFHFFDTALGSEANSRQLDEQRLRVALHAKQLVCHYQPKISVHTGAVVGVEALVRWQTAEGEILGPERFITLAERTGLIKPLGRWVLREAVREISALPALGLPVVDLAINVSAVQLRDREFIGDLQSVLDEFGYAPQQLTLEIAETAFIEDMQQTSEALGEIAQLGVRVSIDDFGTGFGGLSWLRNLPVHEIKIDRSFIKGCAIDAFDATIVSGLIEIAHNLGIQIVAEGVERADQIAFLTQVKCDVMQGYFLGLPMTASELARSTRLWQVTRSAHP